VVDSPEKEQRQRVAARDGLSDNTVMAITQSQTDRSTRLAAADDVIVNDSDITSLSIRVQELHKHYMEIAYDN
jgi:dephospho-CoA kinase